MSDVLNKELKELQLIHNEKKSDSGINLAGFKEKVMEDQDKLRQDLKSKQNTNEFMESFLPIILSSLRYLVFQICWPIIASFNFTIASFFQITGNLSPENYFN